VLLELIFQQSLLATDDNLKVISVDIGMRTRPESQDITLVESHFPITRSIFVWLENDPRMATVSATSDTHLLALECSPAVPLLCVVVGDTIIIKGSVYQRV